MYTQPGLSVGAWTYTLLAFILYKVCNAQVVPLCFIPEGKLGRFNLIGRYGKRSSRTFVKLRIARITSLRTWNSRLFRVKARHCDTEFYAAHTLCGFEVRWPIGMFNWNRVGQGCFFWNCSSNGREPPGLPEFQTTPAKAITGCFRRIDKIMDLKLSTESGMPWGLLYAYEPTLKKQIETEEPRLRYIPYRCASAVLTALR